MVVAAVVVEVVVTVVVDGGENGGLVVMGGKGCLPECHSGAPMTHTSLSSLGVYCVTVSGVCCKQTETRARTDLMTPLIHLLYFRQR